MAAKVPIDAIRMAMKKKKWTGPITGEERLAGAALPQSGKWTATQTGARQAAELKAGVRNAQAVRDAANSTQSWEDFISGKTR